MFDQASMSEQLQASRMSMARRPEFYFGNTPVNQGVATGGMAAQGSALPSGGVVSGAAPAAGALGGAGMAAPAGASASAMGGMGTAGAVTGIVNSLADMGNAMVAANVLKKYKPMASYTPVQAHFESPTLGGVKPAYA